MSTIFNANLPSMVDLIKAENFDGNTAEILGQSAKTDSFMASCPWFETNNGISHKDVSVSKMGTGEFIGVNEGRTTTSSDITVKTSNVCLYSRLSQVEDTLLQMDKSMAQKLRLEQHELNLEGLTQGFTEKIFYSKAVTDPKGFNGLAQRRGNTSLNTNTYNNKYVWDGGQSGVEAATSLFLVEFGKSGVCLRHQEGTKSGFDFVDRGMKTYSKEINGEDRIIDYWEMMYNIWSLLSVKDERSLLRYANINPSGTTNAVDTDVLIAMKNQLPKAGANCGAFVNRNLITQMEILLNAKNNVWYSRGEIENYGPVTKFVNIPLLLQDCIVDNEAIVS